MDLKEINRYQYDKLDWFSSGYELFESPYGIESLSWLVKMLQNSENVDRRSEKWNKLRENKKKKKKSILQDRNLNHSLFFMPQN